MPDLPPLSQLFAGSAPGGHSSPGLKAWGFLADFINVSSYRKDIPLNRIDNVPTSNDVTSCRKAAEQGDAISQARLGEMYINGIGVQQDHAEAVKWYRKAAEQGHADAQSWLGFMYEAAMGVPEDYVEAEKWYRKAAEQGHVHSQYYMGFMYEEGFMFKEGKGVPQDHAEAVKWYHKAAEQGDDEAKARLDHMKDKGEYTEENDMQKVVLDDGYIYYGSLVNGERTGHGTLKFPEGHKIDRYEGKFNKGLFHGSGTVTFVEGIIVSCEWRDGNPVEDEVTMIFPSGDKYIGAVEELMPKGYGTYYYHHLGYKITAHWEDFKPIGNVTMIMQDNSKYEGELKNMLWHGKGVYTASDGSKYIGDFVNGEFHGYGTMTDCNGEMLYSGTWKHNDIFGNDT